MKRPYFIFSFTLLVILSSCYSARKTYRQLHDDKPIEQSIQLNSVKISPKKNYGILPASPKLIDIIHIDLDINFNWGKHECNGKEIIKLKPYFYDTDSILLDAKNMIFSLVEVKNQDSEIIQNLVSYDKKILKINLEKKISNKDTISLFLNYTAKPDDKEKGGSAAIKDDKGLYFINTENKEPFKPIQIWTQGETESNSCWIPCVDKPNEKFTSSLTITVNKDFTILSNGEKVSSVVDGNLKTERWENKKPMSAYLLMMAIGNFEKTTDSLNNKEVSYYLENTYSPFAKEIFSNTTQMISFFGEKLGVEYPWNKYAQVVVRDYVSGAMENTSATLHGDFVQKNKRQLVDANNEDIVAHELFHQWFGDLVTCNTWSHLVLNEGFATYGEYLWTEHQYGTDAALKKSNNRLEKYLNSIKHTTDEAIVNSNFKNQEEMFNSITYQKGACVLHLLRQEIGDDAFFLGLKNYLEKYSYSNTEIDDLRKEFEKIIGKDLQQFFNQWFLKGGHPQINVRYNFNDSTQLTELIIEQTQLAEVGLYKFPLTFKVKHGNQIKYFTFPIEKKREIFYVKKLDTNDIFFPNIIVDPFATFLGEIVDNKSFFYHIKTYNDASNYIEKLRALKELSVVQNQNDSARFTLLSAINDANDDIRLKALELVDWKNAQSYIKAKDILIYLAEKDTKSIVRAKAVEILGDKREPQLLNLYFQLTEDSSYTVAGNALEAIQKLIPAEAIHIATSLEKDAKGKLFDAISDLYSVDGDSSNLSFYNNNLMKVFGRNRAKLLDNYTQLIIKLNKPDYFKVHLDLLTQRATNDENGFTRYASIVNLNEVNNHFSIQAKQNISEEMKNYFINESALLQQNIKSIINQEQVEDVLGLLKLKALYSGVKE